MAGYSQATRAQAELERRKRRANTPVESLFTWRGLARPKQLPPDGEWFIWLLRSGRGFDKTWVGGNWTNELAYTYTGCIIALIGQTKADVRDTMIELHESSILKLAPSAFRPNYEPSKRRVTWPNGSVAIAYSGDEPDQLRGPQHHFAWGDEWAKFKYPRETWDNLEFGLRLGAYPRVLMTTTPRPIPFIRELLADPRCVSVRGATFENADHLPAAYLARLASKYGGTRLGRQELEGEILEENPGALWRLKDIEADRLRELPAGVEFKRIVIAIDPSATSNEESDEAGVIAAGIGTDNHGYIIEDASAVDTPLGWAKTAVRLFKKYRADRIIAETNNGGDMVGTIIYGVDPNVPYSKVTATRGKTIRAEPVAALYEQHKVHHLGGFPELEDQMTTWVVGESSPDRMDALVWALTELMFVPAGLTDEQTKAMGRNEVNIANVSDDMIAAMKRSGMNIDAYLRKE